MGGNILIICHIFSEKKVYPSLSEARKTIVTQTSFAAMLTAVVDALVSVIPMKTEIQR